MASNKQTDRHTHARAQCNHASVGLTQARPNEEVVTSRNNMRMEKYRKIDLNMLSMYRPLQYLEYFGTIFSLKAYQ